MSGSRRSVLADVSFQVCHYILRAVAVEVFLQASQSEPYNVAMMEFRSEPVLKAQPQFVSTVDILRP